MRTPQRFLSVFLCAASLAASSLAAQAQPRLVLDENGRWQREGDAVEQAASEGRGSTEQARRLQGALERYREIARRGGWKKVPTDMVMGPGYSYDCRRIAAVEQRMIAEGYLDAHDRTQPPPPPPPPPPAKWYEREKPLPPPKPLLCAYSAALAKAVKNFQDDRKILGIGQVAKQTMVEMNRPVQEIVRILEKDVARWRGITLPEDGILVNIPFYELQVFENGREALRMPVIVGQPSWQTPTFSATVQYIIVNPDWGIPPKIAKLEYLPSASRNPKWLSAQGIENNGGSLRQKPGPNNPLGRIKFVMPNPNDVYLHDTPLKKAFQAAVKALSHGCVRLSHPLDLATYLLRNQPGWDTAQIERAIATGRTQQIDLRQKMPVTIVYSTSRVNDEGRLELRKDVYGKNGRVEEEEETNPDAHILDGGP